jgi:ATP-dependent Clp protease ATP-binding subunit ClpC
LSANLLLHVREHPNGRVIVTPVDFPELTVDADNYEAALRVTTSKLARQLRSLSGSVRTQLSAPVVAELDRVNVTLKRPRAATVRIAVSLVVTIQETSRGLLFVVRAPEVPQFAVALQNRETVAESAKRALTGILAHWDLHEVMACDDVGETRLETVTIAFPSAEEPRLARGDDPFLLEESGDELTVRAAEGRLGRLDRRDALVERVLAALASPGRSSVMLVGPRDVGKTALLHELASRLAAGDVHPALRGRELWRITANELIAGATYTGMWQDRARIIVARGRAEGAIFAMGDPVAILDAGRWSGSDNNLSRFLRPYVESGEVSLICESTPEQFAAVHKREPSFVDAFHRVDVPEPGGEDAREILIEAGRRLEESQGVEIDREAIDAALELTRRFEPYRALPGKAVDLLDEVVQRIVTEDGEPRGGREEVTATFAERTGLPLLLLSDEVSLRVDEVRAFFEERVLGQDEAVDAMVELVTLAKAGLQDPKKPLGSFFFVGPTGVGKTELTKALAEFLFGSSDRVIRFDMAEHSSGDAVSKLIGTAWRSDGEGELTRRVREQPFCVVLLDEIEKAHPDVFDALLSALGEGRLTDANGRTADFRNAIVVMTSNLGAGQRDSSALGFSASDAAVESERLRRHFVEQAEKFFRPEFFNRIDRVLAFRSLDPEIVRRIARRELGRLLMREGITRRRLLVEIDDAVVETLADRGFHPRYGARPLQREIERAVINPLARLIVEQRPGPGDLVRFTRAGDEICVSVQRLTVRDDPRQSARPTAVGTEATLARAARRAEALHEEVEAEELAPHTQALRTELSALVEQTSTPGFWDDSAGAKGTMERLYQIERVLERFDGLRVRAEGLAEMARQMLRNRDRRRLPELRQAIAEIEDALQGCRLELAGAAAGAEMSQALVSVTPVAGADEWASELVAMYVAWAERTGRDASPAPGGAPFAVSIHGPSTFGLLAREAGLHRRVSADAEPQLARVAVSADGQALGQGEDPVVVRVYSQGRRQFVRDPRTGAKVGDVAAVLGAGRIDDFLLAALRL